MTHRFTITIEDPGTAEFVESALVDWLDSGGFQAEVSSISAGSAAVFALLIQPNIDGAEVFAPDDVWNELRAIFPLPETRDELADLDVSYCPQDWYEANDHRHLAEEE